MAKPQAEPRLQINKPPAIITEDVEMREANAKPIPINNNNRLIA